MNRKWLIVALLPLAFLLYQLTWIPPIYGWRFDLANKQIVNSTSKANVNFVVDIDSGELRTTLKEQPKLKLPSSPRRGPLVEPVLRIYPAQESRSERIPKNWIANFYSRETVTSTRKFSFPAVPIAFGNRFAVGTLETELYSLDLLNPDAKLQTFPSKFSFQVDSWEGPLPLQQSGENSFFRKNLLNGIVEVFAIDPDGAIRLVSYWRYLSPSTADGVYCDGKVIVTVNPVTSAIEQHSAVDGSFLGNLQLSQPVDLTKVTWNFWGHTLRVEDSETVRFFDPRTGVLKQSQPANVFVRNGVIGSKDLFWGCTLPNYNETHIWQMDDLSKAIFVLKTDGIPGDVAMINSNEVVALGDRCGFSVCIYDLRSGKLLANKQPLFWVMPLTIVIVVYYFGWSVLWFQASAKANASPLVDHLLVSAIALVTFYLYDWSCENRRLDLRTILGWPVNQDSFDTVFWMIFGSLNLAICWLVFGKTRWIWRMLTTVVLIVCFLVSLKMQLPQPQPGLSWRMIYLVTISEATVASLLLAIRWRGWRIDLSEPLDSEVELAGNTSFRLMDCFVLISIVAVFIAALKPFLPPTAIDGIYLSSSILYGLITTAALMLAFSKRSWLFSIGGGLVAIVIALFTTLYLHKFHQFYTRLSNPGPVLFCNSLAVPFFLAIPYRLRGWRWSRKPSTTGKDEPVLQA